ncbi:Up-regulated during septation protein 1 domain-containing protein [Madurella fahalii]|uniref:Up-regulated during septation protein 1 domain-containing protein n=1 Tax=Madurella fahalii TaxID=1157608 RepID=A0ABQ0G0K0_9PEZI
MGSTGEETFKSIQKTLEPYIRPREEVARIRQILALHLDSCLEDAAAVGPLALVDTDKAACSSSTTARGLQKQYLEALNANIKARSEFASCCHEQRGTTIEASTITDDHGQGRVQDHLTAIRLRKKYERLQAVEKGLNLLEQKPAALPGFLDPGEIFRDSRPLPDVPKDLVTALALDKTNPGPHLKDTIDQLEKQVLQTKLLLRREEELLENVKSRSTARPESISGRAKLEALNKTRTELINWIETELSKASGDDADTEGQGSQQKPRAPAGSIHLDEQLASIKEKYTQYLEARQALLQLVSQHTKPDIKPPAKGKQPSAAPPAPKPRPITHLLAPYLEQLLSIAKEQKGLIAQKSHLSTAITNQQKENGQIIDHLAEESQLIPAHPMPGASRRDSTFADGLAAAESADPPSRVKPWVFAADSAKISTLEAVAEKIEEGQIALEGTMHALAEVDQLLGQRPSSQRDDDDGRGNAEEDLWLAESRPSGNAGGARKHTSRKAEKADQPKSVWDMLDGNLGLLRADKDPP